MTFEPTSPPPAHPARISPPGGGFWRSRAARFLIMCCVALTMFIPLVIIGALNDDRSGYQRDVAREIESLWGGSQRLAGPFLVVPYERVLPAQPQRRGGDGVEEALDDAARTPAKVLERAVFLPEDLKIDIAAKTELRRRALYEIPVYQAAAEVSGEFARPAHPDFDAPDVTPLWERAYIAVALSDTRALTDNAALSLNGADAPFQPGSNLDAGYRRGEFSGVSAPIGDPRGDGPLRFRFALNFNGSDGLTAAPLGKATQAHISADWGDPSFSGAYLPAERSVSEDGFEATWRVPYLARGFPQGWTDRSGDANQAMSDIASAAFGVQFLNVVDHYRKVDRALKYALMFIGLTFLTIFLCEIGAGRSIHAVQYLLIGLCQSVFFLLLLALSERIGFDAAYGAAAAATVALLAFYTHAGLKIGKRSLVVVGVLAVLYGLLYLLLISAEDALLIGALAAFAAVAVTMAATRNIDWSAQEAR